MTAKRTKGSGLGARMAAAPAPNAVAAGFAAATGAELPAPEPEAPAKVETVALNIRLPKPLHRTLRRIAFDEETSINALLIAGAEAMLAARK